MDATVIQVTNSHTEAAAKIYNLLISEKHVLSSDLLVCGALPLTSLFSVSVLSRLYSEHIYTDCRQGSLLTFGSIE